jgi:type I restriction enzyme M protein
MNHSEQQFLKELDVKLWSAADRLRNNLDAANYKHVVLGIIFLKYVSDAFEERQQELRQLFTHDVSLSEGGDNIYFMPRENYDSEAQYMDAVNADDKYYNAADQRKHISVYGQESNPTTWKLAAMNMAIRGIDFNFGKKNADTFLDDQHPDLRADFVMANPPFNIKDWWHPKLDGDIRWKYGTPPQGNANYGWIQHMLYHLNDNGSMGLLLANGSMSSNTNNEGEIRKALIEADLVECMVALPGQLFTNTQIPACIWFLTKNKKGGALEKQRGKRDRRGETLFVDARNLGLMKDRVLRDFTDADIAKITNCFHAWQSGDGYENEKGFCFSAKLADMQKHDYVLTPGRYVGAVDAEEDIEPFTDKMQRLTAQLKSQFAESARLEKAIKDNLAGIGYELVHLSQ